MPPGGRFGAWLFRGSPAGTRLPWASTAVLTVFVLVGTRFAGRNQPERVDLDADRKSVV